MADNNNDSTVKEEEKDSSVPMDANSDEKVEQKEKEELEDVKDDNEVEEEKSEAEDVEDESEVEEEELPPGLLEQPLEVQGKREKRKVERLSATMAKSAEKKKLEIEEGSGEKLGNIPYIEHKLNGTKTVDLKPLHRLLYLRLGSNTEVKKNIRQFSGFSQPKESKEYEKRAGMLNKMFLPELKTICLILGLERSGTKKDVIDRIMEYLLKPSDKGMKVAKSKKAKRRSKSSDSKKDKKKGVKRKRTPKKKVENNEDDNEGSLDDDDEDGDDDNDEDEVSEVEEDESDYEAPKKKKTKVESKKKASPKVNGKKENASAKKKEKTPVKKKETKKQSPKKKIPSVEVLNDSLSDDSDSDDEPIAKMIKSPPSNDEIKELVKKILDGADLEKVTMKTVVKEVYSKYPTFDLSDRKDFIKNSVREVIS